MKAIIFLIPLLFLVGGCQAPKNFEQALQLLDKAAEVAEKHGIAYDATVRWDGKFGAAWIQRGELDSGITLEVNFHGNAAAERVAVKSNP